MKVAFAGRREDHRLVTGAGRFTADWFFPGEVHGCFLRSDRAHAQIVGIDVTSALEMSGVLACFTGEDLDAAGIRVPPPSQPKPGQAPFPVRSPERHVLATGRVYFVGQPIVLIVAETAAQAQDAAEVITIDYEDLPAVLDAEEALTDGAPELSADVPGNLCFEYAYGDAAAAEAAFAAATYRVEVELDSQRLSGNPLEPKACIAGFDPKTGVFDIYCPTQGLSMIRERFSAGLGVPEDKLRIHAHDVGGGFGVRIEAYPEYLALAFAAQHLHVPVKWVGTRAESIVSDFHGRATKLVGELALDSNGLFLAARYRWIVNAGAYPSTSAAIVNTIGPSTYLVGMYRTPVLYGVHRVALTNTTPTTPYRGSARPNVAYIVERLVDEAAAQLNIDAVELRRRNLLHKEAFPYRTPVGSLYDSADPHGLLETAVQAANVDGFPFRRLASQRKGKLRGLGVSVFIESAGGGRSPHEETAITFKQDGAITIHTMSGASGQGHETVFPEIVSEVLGIPAERIFLAASDPDGPAITGDGSVGSRSVMTHGSALVATARRVLEKGKDLAARQLEVSPKDIEFSSGRFTVAGTDMSVGLDELILAHARPGEHPLDSTGNVASHQSFPSGAHVAEVEIDPETGTTQVVSYVAVDDCGRVINHMLVEGQIHGGVMQAYGQVFGEHCIYDTSGQLVTGSFMDYYMPRADAALPMQVIDRPVPSPNNLLGAKGIGEAGTTGALPTLANAVLNALRPAGVRSLDLPYTPFRVWTALAEAGAK